MLCCWVGGEIMLLTALAGQNVVDLPVDFPNLVLAGIVYHSIP